MTRSLRYALLLLATLLCAVQSGAAERRVFAGGWYATALPNREYAVLIGNSHVETHRGRVELPAGQNVLRPRIAPGKFAGQGHQDTQAWLWDGLRWTSHGPAHGVGPVIFDRAGRLVIATAAQGSQGYRYVDEAGRLWTGDETYADRSNHLWEWTTRGSIQCGQGGDEEGLQCLVHGRRVLVEPGVVRFLDFSADGESLALAWTAPTQGYAAILWVTAAELATLPTYDVPASGDRPPAPPPPTPPQSTPDWGPFFDYLERRWTERNVAACASLGDSQIAECQAEHVHQMVGEWHHTLGHTGFGLLWKPGGSNHHSHSEDWLLEKLADGSVWGMDAVGALGAPHAHIARGTPGREPNPGNWRIPPVPNSAPPPPPPPPDHTAALKARIALLEGEIVTARADGDRRVAEKQGEIDRLFERIAGTESERDAARVEVANLRQQLDQTPTACRVTGPGWARQAFGIRCELVR